MAEFGECGSLGVMTSSPPGHFQQAPYSAIAVRSYKVEVMCRKLGRAIFFCLVTG